MTDLSDTLAALDKAAGDESQHIQLRLIAANKLGSALVRAYRTGQLAPVSSVERVAQALKAEDEHHWSRPDSLSDWNEYATAVIAAMKGEG